MINSVLEFVLLEREEDFDKFVFDSSWIYIEVLPDFGVKDLAHDTINFQFLSYPESKHNYMELACWSPACANGLLTKLLTSLNGSLNSFPLIWIDIIDFTCDMCDYTNDWITILMDLQYAKNETLLKIEEKKWIYETWMDLQYIKLGFANYERWNYNLERMELELGIEENWWNGIKFNR